MLQVGTQGLQALAAASALQKLCLFNCHISKDIATQLLAAFQSKGFTNLRELDLSGNNIEAAEMLDLLTALQSVNIGQALKVSWRVRLTIYLCPQRLVRAELCSLQQTMTLQMLEWTLLTGAMHVQILDRKTLHLAQLRPGVFKWIHMLQVLIIGGNPATQSEGFEAHVAKAREARVDVDIAWQATDPGQSSNT